MTTYTRIQVSKYETYIVFEDDVDVDFFKEINGINDSVDTEVTVDPNNCIKLYTYDNEYGDRPQSIDGDSPFIFDNDSDLDNWLEYNNSDGHQNNPYCSIVVKDGVETIQYEDNN